MSSSDFLRDGSGYSRAKCSSSAVHVPAVRVEDVREVADVAEMPRHDLQDGLRLVVLEGDPPRDLAHLPHAIEDLDAPSDRGQLAGRRMQEERRPGPRV